MGTCGYHKEGEVCPWVGQPYFQCCDRVRSLLWVTILIMHGPFGRHASGAGGQLHQTVADRRMT